MAFPKLWEILFGNEVGVRTLIPTVLPSASTDTKGAVEIATSDEAKLGVDKNKVITPETASAFLIASLEKWIQENKGTLP